MFAMIARLSLLLAFASAFIIAIDEFRHPQKMWVMNLVWPITALYFSVFALWAYFRVGRKSSRAAASVPARQPMDAQSMSAMRSANQKPNPSWQQIFVSTSHCGAGCTIGDIIAEFSLAALGWTLWGSMLYASFAADLFLAWAFGIAFQYFVIKPMRNLTPAQGLIAALKADTLSILAFEIGLFAWMALTYFVFFPHPHLEPSQPQYWFMMQIGMIVGFATSWPMNRLLIEWGTKEEMD